MIKVNITGTLEAIKKELKLQGAYLVEFIVVNNEASRPQYYLLRAVSKEMNKDKYAISAMVGHEVTAECYLNGRKSESDKSAHPYYNNDLKVASIKTV